MIKRIMQLCLDMGQLKLNYQAFPSVSFSEKKLKIILTELDPLPFYLLHREGCYPFAKIRSYINFIISWLQNDKDINLIVISIGFWFKAAF